MSRAGDGNIIEAVVAIIEDQIETKVTTFDNKWRKMFAKFVNQIDTKVKLIDDRRHFELFKDGLATKVNKK